MTKRKTVTLTQMRNKNMETLRGLSDEDLHKFIAGWKVGTADHIAGERELRRREGMSVAMRSWIAIGCSVVAVIISFVALFLS